MYIYGAIYSLRNIQSKLVSSRVVLSSCLQTGSQHSLNLQVAKTIDAGCKPYMAVSFPYLREQKIWEMEVGHKLQINFQIFQPERIDPKGDLSNYDIRSDVWSFGISMIEISTGEYPYRMWRTPFEQLRQVVQEDPPKLPANKFTPEYEDFINRS